MSEIRFETSTDGDELSLLIYGLDTASFSVEDLRHRFSVSPFLQYKLDEAALQKACQLYRLKQQEAAKEQTPPEEDIAAVSIVVAKKLDAVVEVEISGDKMQCHLRIVTAWGGENPDVAALQEHLSKSKVVKGIKQNIVQALATRLGNLAPGTEVRELVAEGRLAGGTRQAGLEYRVIPVQDRLLKPALRDDGTVDMYDFGEIEMVTPGTLLMERIPPVLGEPGFTVLGDVKYAEKPVDKPLQPGDGTELRLGNKNALVATRKGVAMRIENGMEVTDAYCVRDVDLKTGNIHYDGTVMVQGSVKVGMSVKAGGDVMVRDYVESALIEAGGNIIIGKGIIGHQVGASHDVHSNSAKIVCGGDLSVNYAQYADIDAGNRVTVAKHLLHCNVQAQEILSVSPKKNEGRIIGGELRPGRLLECNVLGSPSYGHLLVDFSRALEVEFAQLNKIKEELVERVNVLRGMMSALRQFEMKSGSSDVEEQVRKIRNTVDHFEGLIGDLKQQRKSLQDLIENKRQSFEVRVLRKLFPGVSVRFMQHTSQVQDEHGGCRLKAKPTTDFLGFFSL